MITNAPNNYLHITATTTIAGSDVVLGSFLCASSTSGAVKIVDGAGATVLNTMTMAAGGNYPLNCVLKGPVTITVTGTLDATLFYQS